MSKSKILLNLPLETKFLLEFANLGKKADKFLPFTTETFLKLKRKPQPDLTKLKWETLSRGRGMVAIDEQGIQWWKSGDGTVPEFKRRIEYFPWPKLRDMILKKGMPLMLPFFMIHESLKEFAESKIKFIDFSEAIYAQIYHEINICLLAMIRRDFSTCDEFLEECLYPDSREPTGPRVVSLNGKLKIVTSPYNLYETIVACFADFYCYQTKLHRLLKCCGYCGRFWLKMETAQKMYCSEACEKAFNRRSRENDRIRGKNYRGRKALYKMILKLQGKPWYLKPEEAEKKAKQLFKRGKGLNDL